MPRGRCGALTAGLTGGGAHRSASRGGGARAGPSTGAAARGAAGGLWRVGVELELQVFDEPERVCLSWADPLTQGVWEEAGTVGPREGAGQCHVVALHNNRAAAPPAHRCCRLVWATNAILPCSSSRSFRWVSDTCCRSRSNSLLSALEEAMLPTSIELREFEIEARRLGRACLEAVWCCWQCGATAQRMAHG